MPLETQPANWATVQPAVSELPHFQMSLLQSTTASRIFQTQSNSKAVTFCRWPTEQPASHTTTSIKLLSAGLVLTWITWKLTSFEREVSHRRKTILLKNLFATTLMYRFFRIHRLYHNRLTLSHYLLPIYSSICCHKDMQSFYEHCFPYLYLPGTTHLVQSHQFDFILDTTWTCHCDEHAFAFGWLCLMLFVVRMLCHQKSK